MQIVVSSITKPEVYFLKEYIYLIGCFGVQYRCIFLRVLQYFDEPAGRVKMQRTSKNVQRYCTPKHLISYLLYRVYKKKGNPTLTSCSTKTIQCTCNFFHIRKDQSFTY